MEQDDINRTNMINTTVTYSDDNPTPTSGITEWGPTITAIKAKMVLVNSYNQAGGASTKGVTTDTNVLKFIMIDMAYKCANATKAFAVSTNNNTLKEQVDYTETELKKFAKEVVDDRCQEIHDATNANSAGAANFGLTVPTDITDLSAAINIYRLASQNPSAAKITKSQANRLASEMIREIIRDLLEGKLDLMANTIKKSQNAYWQGYQQARQVINLGSTKAKLRGTVTEKGTDSPLANVKVTISEAGTQNVVKQVITDAEGKYTSGQLEPGNYDFKWQLSGYMMQQELNVPVAAGKEVRRTITLKKGGGSMTISGNVAAGAIANIPVNNLQATEETTVRVKVTNSNFRWYAATGNMEPPAEQYYDMVSGQIIQKKVFEFAVLVGFDEELEDFLNLKNIGNTDGGWEMKFENLGSE